MKLTFSAWNNDRYISLTELLVLFGRFFIGLQWYIRIDEVAPEPGAEQLEAINPNKPIDIFTLLKLVTPNLQIIDGEIIARDSDATDPILVLRAVDSTSWDIETSNEDVEAIVRTYFPDVSEFE